MRNSRVVVSVHCGAVAGLRERVAGVGANCCWTLILA